LTWRQLSSGLLYYPDAAAVPSLHEDELRAVGFSQAMAQTLQLSREMVVCNLPPDEWLVSEPAALIGARLLMPKGAGPWTVDCALLRGFDRLDCSLHGDAAVRRQLQCLLDRADKLSPSLTHDCLAPFSPWRALVAAHLWVMPVD
jgi:DNA-3-methyladenine glycosylase II